METIILIGINLSVGLVCLILGLFVRKGKAKMLLGTYAMMSKKEQEQWDFLALCNFSAWISFTFAFVTIIGCIPILLDFYPIISMLITYCIFSAIGIWGMIYRAKSQRFRLSQ
ncbi:MAG: DUF3784 domain-containing protein [Oscillospiraceae bacterium]|jgi:hypothetical protein|nr:DUF3784 domain-containing protein [Oscillospiraceae bacterium]